MDGGSADIPIQGLSVQEAAARLEAEGPNIQRDNHNEQPAA
jgi:hypothetical protein